jgi:hypothetical protein
MTTFDYKRGGLWLFFYRVAIFDKDKGGHAIISFVAIKTLFFLKRKKKLNKMLASTQLRFSSKLLVYKNDVSLYSLHVKNTFVFNCKDKVEIFVIKKSCSWSKCFHSSGLQPNYLRSIDLSSTCCR